MRALIEQQLLSTSTFLYVLELPLLIPLKIKTIESDISRLMLLCCS